MVLAEVMGAKSEQMESLAVAPVTDSTLQLSEALQMAGVALRKSAVQSIAGQRMRMKGMHRSVGGKAGTITTLHIHSISDR